MASIGANPEPVPPIDDPRLKPLVQRALDSARSAGAQHVDVRLTHTRIRRYRIGSLPVEDAESITVGVRALIDGYWGFASGPVWSTDEMVRLGREASLQAKTNALGKPRVVDLAVAPLVRDGHWTMPVVVDPFTVHPSQVSDMMDGVMVYAARQPYCRGGQMAAEFVMQEKAFGTSDGSYYTQRTYRSGGVCAVSYQDAQGRRGDGGTDLLSPAGMGYELFNEAELRDDVDRILEDIRADLELPVKPIDVGRFDVVMSAHATAQLLDGTIGAATEVDRVFGYEANAGGTSYLNDPMAMLGTYSVGSSALSVQGNRNDPRGVATVAWDDEGVVPEAFPIVSNGVFVDLQTTREGAGWLTDYYKTSGRPMRSHGCANAPAAIDAPMSHTANLVMTPASTSETYDSLVSNLDKGIAFKKMIINMDFQQLNGLAYDPGWCYEVTKGKKTARLIKAGLLFRAPELWKSLQALGGSDSVRTYGLSGSKGQPSQTTYHSVSAVPARFEKMTVIDVQRKA